MTIKNTHPEYNKVVADLIQMADCYAGQRVIKEAGVKYLRATSSMVIDGALKAQQPGYDAYLAYKDRAIFPEVVQQAAGTMTGILNKDIWSVELPSEMEPILENATRQGETLHQLLRRMHEAQLVYGRIGLLVDTAPDRELPFFVTYDAKSIINWSDRRDYTQGNDSLDFVITEEIEQINEGIGSYAWVDQEVHRALFLDEAGRYSTHTEMDQLQSEVVVPTFRGKSLDFVPFSFVNASDLEATPGIIPLLGSSNAALSIYQGEADLRQTIHHLGQETLVIIGVAPGSELDDDQPTRIGAGAIIELPEGADAKFIGISGVGLTEQRMALEDDYKRAMSEGSRLLENTSSQAESGEALKVRVAAKTTTLRSIARTSALGLETALKQMARWMGADESAVRVIPVTDFTEDSLAPQEMLNLMQAKAEGLPMSYSSIHEYLVKHDVAEKRFDDELAEIAAEGAVLESIRKSSMVVASEEAQAERAVQAAEVTAKAAEATAEAAAQQQDTNEQPSGSEQGTEEQD